MTINTTFSNADIIAFCQATMDSNVVHSPEYMSIHNKEVVVPGMYLFSFLTSKLIASCSKTTSCNTIEIFLGSLISAGEEVCLMVESALESQIWYLSAINSKDCFRIGENRSSLSFNSSPILKPTPSHIRILPFTNEQLTHFKRLLHTITDEWSDLLFTITYASQALFKAIAEPLDEVENEINRLLDKSKNPDQVSPFYQWLKIEIPEQRNCLNHGKPIEYHISFDREVANRAYIANVECRQDDRLFYHSKYKLIAIPDRLIMRMAKNL
jgi:hypothetical protein